MKTTGMNLFLLVAMLFALCPHSKAGERTEQQMRSAAVQVLKANGARGIVSSQPSMTVDDGLREFLSKEKLKVYGYDGGGFAVVTTDDRYKAVIGYSSSCFTDRIPCGLEWWMETINENLLNSVEQTNIQGRKGISPLLTTEWGQERPFNDNCTFSNSGRTYQCITGCVATAFAQLLNYYKYPTCGTGSISYDIKYNNDFTITFSEDFSQSVYDWSCMLDSYKSYSNNSITDSYTRAVAKLMKDCGLATRTSYSDKTHGSSSSLEYVEDALKNYFCYDNSTKYYSRSNFTKEDWLNMVYDELDNGRPIIYSGMKSSNATSGGHAFVLHGYDSSGKVYVNWGWNGQCDGYYDLDLLNPDRQQYGYKQAMVIAKPGDSTITLYDVTILAKGAGNVCYGGANGTEVRDGSQLFKVREGNNFTLQFSPDMGSKIERVKVNDVDVTSSIVNNECRIDNVLNAMTVEVEFAEETTASDDDYNLYITCYVTGYSMTQVGTIVNKTVGFTIGNSGKEDIFITKMVAKDSNTSTILASSTDTNVLGNLGGGSSKSLSFTINRDVTPVFELEYTIGDRERFYASYQYRILTIESNDYGSVIFADIPVRTESMKFSVEPGDNAEIELVPDEGCELSKLIVNSSDVTSNVSGSQYVLNSIYTNTSVKATFDDVSGNRPSVDGHEYVDLGLKSGKCWSIVNYGAKKAEDSGLYSSNASVSSWGTNWTVPTKDDFQELMDYCEWTWDELNGMKGFTIKGRNGNKMFLPAAGQNSKMFGDVTGLGTNAYYLTSSKGLVDTWIFSADAVKRDFFSTHIIMEEFPIRPISKIIKAPYYVHYILSINAKGSGSVVFAENPIREKTSQFDVREDTIISISLVPEKGYRIKCLKEDGADVTEKITENKYEIVGISKDVTIEVEFELIPFYALIYKIGEETYKTYNLEEGATLTPESSPSKEGYTFLGWSEIPSTMPAHDVTVTGTFAVNTYKLTYMLDGVEYKSYEMSYGSDVTSEVEPTKEGYTFSGWDNVPATMPAHDVSVTGIFTVNKYKLTYMVDNQVYKIYEVEYGASITSEQSPSKDSYIFSGWSEVPVTMPAKDVIITGTFTYIPPTAFTITYMVDGEVYKTQNYYEGTPIIKEEYPSKEGYTFSGWSWIPSTMPSENISVIGTFTINTYKLTYEVDGVEYSVYDVTYGAIVNPESEPTKEGYSFSGWSNLPGTMPARDVIVTGLFTVNKYKLIYMVDEEVYKTLEMEYGAAIVPESMPQKENYTFSGWSEIPTTMPAQDVTITGSFTYVPPTEYTITYMVDGEVYKTVNFYEGETITKEDEPFKEGYTFSGWSWIPSTMPSENMTVAGTFRVNTYKLNYIVDGTEYMSFDVEYGTIISPEKEPTKEGYNFSGWSDLPETMPAQDVTIVGSFTQKEMFTENSISYEVLANNTVAVIDGKSVSGKIEIPETVIHDGMFYIVSSIKENAFKDNKNLTELTISKYVSSIEAFAFEGCIGLKVIICHLENPLDIDDPAVAKSSSVFAGLDKENCVLCVPENSVELYKAAAGWRDFKIIVSISYYVGVEDVNLEDQDVHIYDLQGNRLNKMHKGINIIRLKNGTSKTVLLK